MSVSDVKSDAHNIKRIYSLASKSAKNRKYDLNRKDRFGKSAQRVKSSISNILLIPEMAYIQIGTDNNPH